jgi:hypothetical protein
MNRWAAGLLGCWTHRLQKTALRGIEADRWIEAIDLAAVRLSESQIQVTDLRSAREDEFEVQSGPGMV